MDFDGVGSTLKLTCLYNSVVNIQWFIVPSSPSLGSVGHSCEWTEFFTVFCHRPTSLSSVHCPAGLRRQSPAHVALVGGFHSGVNLAGFSCLISMPISARRNVICGATWRINYHLLRPAIPSETDTILVRPCYNVPVRAKTERN